MGCLSRLSMPSSTRSWTCKEVCKVGAKAFEFRPETGEGADLPEVLGGGPVAVYGNAGQHCHYG
jgi:hypothetical protein